MAEVNGPCGLLPCDVEGAAPAPTGIRSLAAPPPAPAPPLLAPLLPPTLSLALPPPLPLLPLLPPGEGPGGGLRGSTAVTSAVMTGGLGSCAGCNCAHRHAGGHAGLCTCTHERGRARL